MIGLTVATIVGVPMANVVGQWIGWRWGFVIVAVLAAMTATAVYVFAPRAPADAGRQPPARAGALAKGRVWLTLGIGAIGFGGMFCVYTYLASTMRGGDPRPPALPVVLAVFGAA